MCRCREIARILADDYRKRVMIVDTSNEIGGDGDIPHPGIGGARRLQVPNSDMQHKACLLFSFLSSWQFLSDPMQIFITILLCLTMTLFNV